MARRVRPRVLITGANGFLGRAFIERFADRYEIVGLGRAPSSTSPTAPAPIDWLNADLREPLPLRDLPRRVDAVMHLASVRAPSVAHAAQELFSVNAAAVAALLQYAKQVGARFFILGSTGGVCGYRTAPITERTTPAPFDLYTLSKWHGETISRHFDSRSMAVAIVRYFFPYGPGQKSGIIARLVESIRTQSPLTLYSGGRHPVINPVFIDDACELTRRVLDARIRATINCAGPQAATIRQIATIIGELSGRTPSFVRARNNRITNMVGSLRVARQLVGFVPRVDLRAGLANALGPL